MASLRLKIQIGEDESQTNHRYHRDDSTSALKFVYVCDLTITKTIEDLEKSLEKFICQHFSWKNFQLVQLITNDRFLLCKFDRCCDVLKDNDHLICIEMGQFAREYASSIDSDNFWLELKDHDDSDNTEKYLQVGLMNRSKLFIRMRGADNIYALYLFSIHDLLRIAREKRQENLIARYEGFETENWFLEARWHYNSTSNDNLAVLCQLKVVSNETIVSNKLNLVLDVKRFEIRKGDLEILSGSDHDASILTDEQRTRLKQLQESIPPAKRVGPEISFQRPTSAKLNKYECEGESTVRMSCGNTNTLMAYQDLSNREENIFRQEFTLTHIIFSKKQIILPEILQQKRSTPAEKPVSVTHLSILYQNSDGAWKECDDVVIAPVTVRNEQPRWLTDSVIHVEPDKLFSFLIRGSFLVKGHIGRDNSTRQRIHKSLPQPFKLKIVATDNFGKQSSLIVESVNKPLQVENREHFLKHNHWSVKELLAFIFADDCELDERIFVAICIGKENDLIIKNSNTFSVTLDRRALRTLAYQARQSQTNELPLESLHYQSYGNECRIFLLFDSQTKLFYGIRVELTTQTSKTEETIFISTENLFGAG